MSYYRFVGVASDHSVVRVQEVYCDDDDRAEIVARGTLGASEAAIVAVEIWEGTRLVCRVQRES